VRTSASARIIRSLLLPTAASHSAMASSVANSCTSCRLARAKHRNGQKGTVPTKGRPGRDLDQIKARKGEGEPRKRPPLFFVFSRNCHGLPLGGRGEGEDRCSRERLDC